MARVAFVIGDYPSEERSRREKVALSYATAEVEVGIVSAPVTPLLPRHDGGRDHDGVARAGPGLSGSGSAGV